MISISETGPTYGPLNAMKPVADGVWIVDGPIIRFGPRFLQMPFPTRMTVIRLGGDLFVHSPTMLTPRLQADVGSLGRVRYLVAPNRLHYWWLPQWRAAFAGAEVFVAPKVIEQAAGRITFECRALERDDGYPWNADVATLLVRGSYMTEAVFFHRATRTLVLTDLIENFEPDKIGSWLMRLLTRIGGVRDPHGGMPRDMRATFSRPELRAAVQTMIDWDPERVIIAHGRWYDCCGRAELERAFRWLLV